MYLKKIMKIPFWIIFKIILLSIVGCSSLPLQNNELIDELVVINSTNDSLVNVVLKVPETGSFVETNRILPKRQYSWGFPATKNQRNKATLSWLQKGKLYQRSINTVIPDNLKVEFPSKVVITIDDNGILTSKITPHANNN